MQEAILSTELGTGCRAQQVMVAGGGADEFQVQDAGREASLRIRLHISPNFGFVALRDFLRRRPRP